MRRHVRAALLEHPDLMPVGAILWPADPADDEPIRILNQGDGPAPGCQDVFEMDPRTRLMRGTCPCGWRTEEVESRQFEELRAMTMAHVQAGMAALAELLQRGLYSYAHYAALVGITVNAGRHPGYDGFAASLDGAAYPPARATPALDWGDPLTEADANWPSQGSTCAHICGAGPDHACDARATTRLVYKLPSGGTRSMPICGPCHESETAAKDHANA
jgi:hypothetical protein